MKKLTLTLCAVVAVASASYAGTTMSSGKEMKQVEQAPCPTWYADNEFNVGVSLVYAATTNEWEQDRFLGVDHAWGGAIDAKYFFARYFGVGVQGFGLSTNRDEINNVFDDDNDSDFAGGVLGTFTLRYPIPCTRFAPYVWAGVGGVWGGDDDNNFNPPTFVGANNNDDDDDGRLMAQYGAGFEVRFTPRIGLTNDISWNQVEGHHNDFIQVRTGLNFAF
jgi:hypothetical protein